MHVRRLDHPWLNDSEWPLLRVTFPSNGTFSELADAFRSVEAFYAQNSRPFAWIVDTTAIGFGDAKARQLTAQHEERTKEHKSRYNCGSAFVVKSTAVRGILTAVFWVAPPAYPHQVVSNLEAARVWTNEKLGRRLRAEAGSSHE